MWLGPGHADMCHMGRAVVTSRWGFLGQGHQGLEEQMIYGEHKQVGSRCTEGLSGGGGEGRRIFGSGVSLTGAG